VPQRRDRQLWIRDGNALGNFELESIGWQTGVSEGSGDIRDEVRLLELSSRHIHAYHQRTRGAKLCSPSRDLGASL
jgi:hypothetical protein